MPTLPASAAMHRLISFGYGGVGVRPGKDPELHGLDRAQRLAQLDGLEAVAPKVESEHILEHGHRRFP